MIDFQKLLEYISRYGVKIYIFALYINCESVSGWNAALRFHILGPNDLFSTRLKTTKDSFKIPIRTNIRQKTKILPDFNHVRFERLMF